MSVTVSALIREPKNQSKNSLCTILFRVRSAENRIDLRVASKLKIEQQYWDVKKQGYKRGIKSIPQTEQSDFNNKVAKIIDTLTRSFHTGITSKEIKAIINANLGINHEGSTTKPIDTAVIDIIDQYLSSANIEEGTKAIYRTLKDIIKRFDLYNNQITHYYFIPTRLKDIDVDWLESFRDYLTNETEIVKNNTEAFSCTKERILPRGSNTVIKLLKKLRTFYYWCIEQEYTAKNPFTKVTIGTEVYGTPIYINIEERNKIYNLDLSGRPELAAQRDIFVFQCCIGCRVCDLYGLRESNIVDGFIEYIAIKGKHRIGKTVSVPLIPIAKEIIDRHKGHTTLLPFISEQNYNLAIKEIFELAGLTRNVTVRDPITGLDTQKRLCDIASSHMARRTFTGNIYKKVKDPNLVGSMTGHAEGSRAFTRYRDIDKEIKQEIIKNIEL